MAWTQLSLYDTTGAIQGMNSGLMGSSYLQPLRDDLLFGQDLESVVLLGMLDQHDLPKGALAQYLDLLQICQGHFLQERTQSPSATYIIRAPTSKVVLAKAFLCPRFHIITVCVLSGMAWCCRS